MWFYHEIGEIKGKVTQQKRRGVASILKLLGLDYFSSQVIVRKILVTARPADNNENRNIKIWTSCEISRLYLTPFCFVNNDWMQEYVMQEYVTFNNHVHFAHSVNIIII